MERIDRRQKYIMQQRLIGATVHLDDVVAKLRHHRDPP